MSNFRSGKTHPFQTLLSYKLLRPPVKRDWLSGGGDELSDYVREKKNKLCENLKYLTKRKK